MRVKWGVGGASPKAATIFRSGTGSGAGGHIRRVASELVMYIRMPCLSIPRADYPAGTAISKS